MKSCTMRDMKAPSVTGKKAKVIKLLRRHALVMLTVSCAQVSSIATSAEIPARGVLSKSPAARWEDGHVTGNGTLGAIVMGNPANETVIGNHSGLWLPLFPVRDKEAFEKAGLSWGASHFVSGRRFIPDIGELLPKVRELIKREGIPAGYYPAQKLVCDEAARQGYMGYQHHGSYHPGFKLHLDMPAKGAVRDYQRTTDFQTGEVRVNWADEQGNFVRRMFSSRPDGVIVWSIKADAAGKVNGSFKLGDFANMYLAKMECVAARDEGNGWLTVNTVYEYGKEENKGGYVAAIRIVPQGGKMSVTGKVVQVSDADSVLCMMRIQRYAYGVPAPIESLKKELAAVSDDYDLMMARHAKVHGTLFNRAKLDLGGAAESNRPVEDLLREGEATGTYSAALLEKLFDVCRYTIISSSGELPPNGKGIWIGQWADRWNTVYTLDDNLQLEVQSMLSANMPEMMEPLFNMIMNPKVMADYRANAWKIMRCRGILLPQVMGTDSGLSVTWGPEFSATQWWTAGGAWFASIFYDYYRYTGDKKLLKERVVPFMKEVALFYEDFLFIDDTGKYRFSPGWSPENMDWSGAGDNPTMDIAACKEMLTNLIEACETLSIEGDNLPKWKQMIAKFPPYLINKDGALQEWATPNYRENYVHRHLSHLYTVWGSRELSPAQPELWKAARVAFDKRFAVCEGGTHSLSRLMTTANYMGEGELSYSIMTRMLREKYFYNSLMTAHFANHDVLYIDGTGAWGDNVLGMIVDSWKGTLNLLPALPSAMPKGEIRDTLARGQITINRLAWDKPSGKLDLELTSAIDQTINLCLPNAKSIKEIKVQSDVVAKSPLGENARVLKLTAGKAVPVQLTFDNTDKPGAPGIGK